MNTSQDVRKKFALLLSTMIGSCMHKARAVPYILKQDEIINMLIEDPALFEKLIQEEQSFSTGNSKSTISVNFDTVTELQKIDTIDSIADNYRHLSETEINSFLDLVNQMIQTFGIFISNTFTLMDKRMAEFVQNYREFLKKKEMDFRKIDFTVEETGILEESAMAYINKGEFLQAFTFARLLNDHLQISEIIQFPQQPMPIYENLIRHSLKDPVLASNLIRFILHVSYLSQGSWNDLYQILSSTILKGSGEFDRLMYIEAIERNIVFCCNLLYKSIEDIRDMPPAKIRIAVLRSLEEFRN